MKESIKEFIEDFYQELESPFFHEDWTNKEQYLQIKKEQFKSLFGENLEVNI